jgi:hypothetical protein
MVRDYLSEGIQIPAVRHTEMAKQLTVLLVAISSTA